jgi:broad specificity phosphatase PhoE
MAVLRFITHPNVTIDPSVPVPQWGLSDRGRERAHTMLLQPWVPAIGAIFASHETKAIETAAVLAAHLALPIEAREALGENDRSSTGFVPPDRFEELANAFFGAPTDSIVGWETAVHAQQRIVHATADLLAEPRQHDVAVIAHGAVGTLLLCHLAGWPIDRSRDQPGGGGGNMFAVEIGTMRLIHGWHGIDDLNPPPATVA